MRSQANNILFAALCAFSNIASSNGIPPPETLAAEAISASQERLNAIALASGHSVSYTASFYYGVSQPFVQVAASPAIINYPIFSNVSFNATVSNLQCGTTYQYFAYQEQTDNPYNNYHGDTLSFTTAACPVPIPSLSEWTLLILALVVMSVIGWHFRNQQR